MDLLFTSVEKNDLSKVHKIIKQGANINLKDEYGYIRTTGEEKRLLQKERG